jgi:hypothetical protein
MGPTAPLTTGQFTQAIWALLIGRVAPWVTIIPVWIAIDRYRDRRAARLEQARAAHQAATQPKPKRSPRPSRDPFEEEDA